MKKFRNLSDLNVDGDGYEVGLPPDQADLDKLAARFDVSLPADYVTFLKAINGGFPELTEHPNTMVKLEVLFRVGHTENESGLESEADSYKLLVELGLPKSMIVFGREACGDYILLIEEEGKWSVSAWEHETDDLSFVAGSLTAYINALEPEED